MLGLMLLIFFLIVLIFLGLVNFVKWHFSYWERRKIPHSKPRIPYGNMHKWLRTKHLFQIIDETYEEFKGTGPFAGFYFNTQIAAVILEPIYAYNILSTDFRNFTDRGFFHNPQNDPLTGNLYLLDGPEWETLRNKLLGIYGKESIKKIYISIYDIAIYLETVFREKARESPDGCIDVNYLFARYTTDVIGNSAFGAKHNCLRAPRSEFFIMARKFFSQRRHSNLVENLINCFPSWAKALRMKIIPNEVSDYFLKNIESTVAARKIQRREYPDFLSLLLEHKKIPSIYRRVDLSLEELAAQAFSFFITAHDTCTATMSYALFELARNQQIQDKMRKEIVEQLQKNDDTLTPNVINDMVYVNQVVMETLRKYPPVPVLFRKCTEHYTTSNREYYIKKGTTVIIPTYSFHHDPEYFPRPHIFDPDRFSSENRNKVSPGYYLPFGYGQRGCAGKEIGLMIIKTGLIKLLERHKFETCDRTEEAIKIPMRSFNLNPFEIILKVTEIKNYN